MKTLITWSFVVVAWMVIVVALWKGKTLGGQWTLFTLFPWYLAVPMGIIIVAFILVLWFSKN